MRNAIPDAWRFVGVAWTLAALAIPHGSAVAQLGGLPLPSLPLPLPLPGGADPSGPVSQASGIVAIVNGNVTSLVDTGTLTSASDPLAASSSFVGIPGLLSGETAHAVTMGWTDQVVSESSLGALSMTVAGLPVTANFVMSRAKSVSGAGNTGSATVDGLAVAGVQIVPTGAPNQTISLYGLSITLNEQIQSAGGIVVNALRVKTLDGLTDVIVGSAKAGPL